MFFYLRHRNKKVKELRKNVGFTAKELADTLRIEVSTIINIDDQRLKDVEHLLCERLIPIFRGDIYDKIPW